MTKWLLSIVGVVFLGVLFDLIYPNGKTNTLCKSIFGIFAVFVLISPLLKIDIDKFSFVESNSDVLIENINDAKGEALELKIINYLSKCGIKGVNVKIESILNYNGFIVENIFVDTTNLVLTENISNINKYEVIINEIVNVIKIDKEKIVVYG